VGPYKQRGFQEWIRCKLHYTRVGDPSGAEYELDSDLVLLAMDYRTRKTGPSPVAECRSRSPREYRNHELRFVGQRHFLPPATLAADNRWSFGRSRKGAKPRLQSIAYLVT